MATQLYNTLFNHPFFTTRFNIPEVFGRCLTYEAQIHCLLCLLDEIAGAEWVSPDEFNDEVTKLINMINELEKKLQEEIDNLDSKVEQYHTELNNKIDQVNQDLSTKISSLDTKVENYYKALGDEITNLDSKVENHYKTLGDEISSLTQQFNTYKTENNANTTQISADLTALTNRVTTAEGNVTNLAKTRASIAGNIYGATLASDGTLTLPSGTKIPVADLNLWSNNASPTASAYANALRSRAVTDGDIKGV